jgi:predicted metalloprotease with PDZ domain
MSAAAHYRVEARHPEAHRFLVTLTIPAPDPAGQRLAMAAWIPGSYMIRDFAKHVVRLAAHDGDAPVAVEKLDKQTWRCAPCGGPLTVEYEVYAWDLSVRGAHLDTTHAYFNGTSLFLAVAGREAEPCTVELVRPEGDAYARWRVATTLPRGDAPLYGFGGYRAGDFEELVDHPVEMGGFDLIEFDVAGVPHTVAITGRHHCDTVRLARDLQRLCGYQIGLFGELPAERYLFLTTVVGDGYGGLEHRSSTSLLACRHELPRQGLGEPDEGYRNFLGLCSHEYFHTWNIKRIKPAAFQPYDLSREVHTRQLWAFEGFTSYYDDLALVRAGLIGPEAYLELLGRTITRVLRTPGRFVQSVTESSFDAWTKFYKQDENAANAIVSYYVKGAVIALALDLTLRRETAGRVGLDEVMRGLWIEFGKPGIGLGEAELEAAIEHVAGVPLQGFFDHALRGTDDLPLAELLASVGVGLHLRPAENDGDKGGKPVKNGKGLPELGVRLGEGPEAKLACLFDGRPAQKAGLAAGDVLVALDGLKVDKGSLERRLAVYRPGETVAVHAFRRDELMTFTVELAAPPADTCYLTLDAAPEEVLERRRRWLCG